MLPLYRVLGISTLVLLTSACASSSDDGNANDKAVTPEDTPDTELKTKVHEAIARDGCEAAGLPKNFCRRAAAETFNVDKNEWTDLAAHAQPETGESTCKAANAVVERLRTLGDEVRERLRAGVRSAAEADELAKSMGRALHTLQDNCAHEGMSNPQHSWYSVRDWCARSGESPDDRPAAVECAKEETAALFSGLAKAVGEAKVPLEALDEATKISTHNPSRKNACEFLYEWGQFDGNDGRWDNAVTVPVFRKTLLDAFDADASKSKSKGDDLCDGRSIAVANPRERVSVADPFCITLKTFCLGYNNDFAPHQHPHLDR